MRGNKAKIQVTVSEVPDLHFVDIYIPLVETPDDSPHIMVDHHKDYLHISFSTTKNPSYMYRGQGTFYKSLDDKLFSDYDVMDFWDLNNRSLKQRQGSERTETSK